MNAHNASWLENAIASALSLTRDSGEKWKRWLERGGISKDCIPPTSPPAAWGVGLKTYSGKALMSVPLASSPCIKGLRSFDGMSNVEKSRELPLTTAVFSDQVLRIASKAEASHAEW
jgi:hypothetical protein